MNPRLVRYYGTDWFCAVKLPGGAWLPPLGEGKTKEQAYDAWRSKACTTP